MNNPPWLEQLCEARRRIQERDEADKAQREAVKRWKHRKPIVAGSQDVRWKPIDRLAAIVVARANWIHKQDAFGPAELTEQPKEKKHMARHQEMSMAPGEAGGKYIPGSDVKHVWGAEGFEIKPTRFNDKGEPLFSVDDMHKMLVALADRQPKEVNPMVDRAKSARAIVSELLDGLGYDMERFKDNVKQYLEEIRQTRFAIVAEAAQISHPLKELRQFFMGPDYKGEIARLKEFVDLCERLAALKENGFLDKIADTMLALAVKDQ